MTKATQLASLGSVITTPEGSAPVYSCRAWVNFNGTGTVAIRASGNVTSIADNGVGNYTVNYASTLSDANYSLVAACATATVGRTASVSPTSTATYTTTSSTIGCVDTTNTNIDPSIVSVAIFR